MGGRRGRGWDRRQHGRRARSGARRRRHGRVDRHVRHRLRRVGPPVRRPDGRGGGVRRRHRSLPAARVHAERGQGARCGPRSARRRSRRVRPVGDGRRRRVGLTLLPYFDGERTPNRPDATGVLGGLRTDVTREQLARAAVDGVVCGLLDGVDALAAHCAVERIVLTGGGRPLGGGAGGVRRSVRPAGVRDDRRRSGGRRRVRAGRGDAERRAARVDRRAVGTRPRRNRSRPTDPPTRSGCGRGTRRCAASSRRSAGLSAGPMDQDPFELLGIDPTSTVDDVHRARRRLAQAGPSRPRRRRGGDAGDQRRRRRGR